MKIEDLSLGKRYSRALFEVALQQGVSTLEQVQGALDALAQFWSSSGSEAAEENARMREALTDPRIPDHLINQILMELAEKLLPGRAFFGNFLVTLNQNGRLDILEVLASIFAGMVREFRRSLALQIISANELSQPERDDIAAQVSAALPQHMRELLSFSWDTDNSLIGGMLVRSGDSLLDGSVRGSLNRMQQLFGVNK